MRISLALTRVLQYYLSIENTFKLVKVEHIESLLIHRSKSSIYCTRSWASKLGITIACVPLKNKAERYGKHSNFSERNEKAMNSKSAFIALQKHCDSLDIYGV